MLNLLKGFNMFTGWYGLLVILINAKPSEREGTLNNGYGLLVILINAKLETMLLSAVNGYGLLVILINAKLFIIDVYHIILDIYLTTAIFYYILYFC